ncbi:MAG: 5-(carboxyamino)imidazole ribonucleotide mutase [Balneolaceae bacterium]
MSESKAIVSVVMGSDSDWPTMKQATEILDHFGVPYEKRVVSAHRTPDDMADFGKEARNLGLKIIIAGAGGAAHLPGMLASHTILPVIGVPIQTSALGGVDSLYSIVQMPNGIPVATVAIGKAQNAGLLAVRMLGVNDEQLAGKLEAYHRQMAEESREKTRNLK